MTRPLLFSISLLILGIFIGIVASKYLPAFSPLTPEAVCQKGRYQEVRTCGGYFIAGRPCCDQGADIWNGKNQIVVSCGGYMPPPGAPESKCEKLLKAIDTKNCQELVCSLEDAKKIKPPYSFWEQPILFIRQLLSRNAVSQVGFTAVKVTTTPPFINPTTTGTLVATVMRSPTCAGAQRPGETCEAPVDNETFNIIRLSDNRIIQSVRTDKDGKLMVSLASGTYQLQSNTRGIGKIIENPDFTIISGQTTTQQFDIDTGIR